MISKNKQITVDLSEKLASKYLNEEGNDFSRLIHNRFSITDDQLIIRHQPEYLVSDVHAKRGYFVYEDQLNSMKKMR